MTATAYITDYEEVVLEEGRQEGWQKGMEEGLQEGLQKGRQQAVLDLLALRHHAVPAGLEEAVRAVADEAQLKRLLASAAQCKSLEDFASSL